MLYLVWMAADERGLEPDSVHSWVRSHYYLGFLPEGMSGNGALVSCTADEQDTKVGRSRANAAPD